MPDDQGRFRGFTPPSSKATATWPPDRETATAPKPERRKDAETQGGDRAER